LIGIARVDFRFPAASLLPFRRRQKPSGFVGASAEKIPGMPFSKAERALEGAYSRSSVCQTTIRIFASDASEIKDD
jgi:hypothetical protein